MKDVEKLIVGSWRLVHSKTTSKTGAVSYPLGEDAIGYIHYSPTGIMSVQISRRSKPDDGKAKDIRNDYLAYFGRYEIDAERSVVRHLLEGQLVPGQFPAILERRFHFEGDTVSLKPLDYPDHEILWQRD